MNTLKITVRTPPGKAEVTEKKLRRDAFAYTKSPLETRMEAHNRFVWVWEPKDQKEQERVVRALGKAEGRIKGVYRVLIPLLRRACKAGNKASWTKKKVGAWITKRFRKLAGKDAEIPDLVVGDGPFEIEDLEEFREFLKKDMFSVEEQTK